MYLLPLWVRVVVVIVALVPAVLIAYRDRYRILGRCYWCQGFVGFLSAEDDFFCSDWCLDECAALHPPVGLDA